MENKYNSKIVTVIKKQVKNISLKVKPDTQVILTVPLHINDSHIQSILDKRTLWIDKKIEYFENIPNSIEKEYVSGENFKYLGKNYRLKVIKSTQVEINLQRNFLELKVKNKKDFNTKRTLIDNWYQKQANIYFQNIIDSFHYLIKSEVKKLRIRKMKTRWGSCNPSKKYINLNSELIKKPTICIEYVILHEMVHLLHPNHNLEFYNFLTTYMPDWKHRKQLLEHYN